MPTIKPTVGRNLLFYPSEPHVITNGSDPCIAFIVGVISDDEINIATFDFEGFLHRYTGVTLWSGEGEAPEKPYATWMQYQKDVVAGKIEPVKHAEPTKAPEAEKPALAPFLAPSPVLAQPNSIVRADGAPSSETAYTG